MPRDLKQCSRRALIAAVDFGLALAFPWRRLRRRGPVPADPHRVLVCRVDHIGDVFLSLPALARVRAHYPNAQLTVLVASWAAALLRAAGCQDQLLVCDPPWWVAKRKSRFGRAEAAGGWLALWKMILTLRARRFDLCIELRGDVRQIVAFGVLGGARFLLTRRRNGGAGLADLALAINESMHECDQNLALVGALGIVAAPPVFPEPCSAADVRRVQELLGRLREVPGGRTVVVHPGAKWVNRWPVEAYIELLRGLADPPGGVRVLLTGAAAESALCEQLAAALPGQAHSLAGCLTLTETAALFAAADLVVMADTGPMHFLNAIATPALLLFGPTAAARFAPRGPHITLLGNAQCCAEGLHEICTRVAPGAASACMAQLGPQEVLRHARAKLGPAQPG